jgi:hypothetical protein
MNDLTPPQDIAAERAVLGCCLVSPTAYAEAVAILSTEDWYRPAHAALWLLMRRVAASGTNVDPITVNAALATSDADTRRLVTSVLIADLIGTVGVAASVGHYAALVADAGLRRRLIAAAEGIAQRAVELESVADAAEWAVSETTLVRNTQHTSEATDIDVHELLNEQIADEWVIPGLLATGDRLILTASEGLGKSTLLRQIAVCTAAGLHPFRAEPIDPQRVLVVDCENGRKLSRDRYRPLLTQASALGAPVGDRLRIDIRPQGLNLLDGADASLLLRTVDRVKPKLLLIGPIYRLHEDDPNDEKAARRIAAVLDRARASSGCAIITEAHTPHTDGANGHMLRPFGSSLWKRWPEFGYCLKLTADSDLDARQCRLIPWRGPRDERDWPAGLVAGGSWPWTPLGHDVMRYAS